MGKNTDSDKSIDGIARDAGGTKKSAGRSFAQQLRTIVLMCLVSTVGSGWLLFKHYLAGSLLESSEAELVNVDMKLAEHINGMRFGVIQVQQ